jgi:PAS domain S-box-containing protein
MKFVVFPNFNKTLYFVVSGILTASLLLFDFSLESGVAGGVTYIILVLFSLWGGKRGYIIWAGITATICIWLGYYFSPVGGEHWKVLLNRSLAVFVIWIAVAICRAFQKSQDIIRANAVRLSNESRLKAILDNTVDGIITIDTRGIIKSFNPAAERLFGYSELEAIGQNVKFLMPDPWKSEHDQYLQNYLQTGEEKIIGKGREVFGQRKDGSTFPMELGVNEMFVGEKRMFTGITRDISEREEKKAALERAMNQNALILNSAGDGIYGLDIEGNTTFANPAATEMLGYSAEELIGKPQHALIHHSRTDGTPYPRDECHIYAAFKDGRVHREANEVFWRKDGSSFSVEYVSTPIREKGEVVGAVVTFQDITERKTHEVQINRALKTAAKSQEEAEQAKGLAESASKAKGEFLAHMSHEIRTPLNAIIGYSQILNRTPDLASDQKKAVQTIETSGNHLLELINEVLDYSKIEAGTKELIPKDFDLQELLEGLLALFENRCEDKNLMIRLEGTDQTPIYVNGDMGKLRQVLVNLLGNAVKFTTAGKIVLNLERKPDNKYKFQVIDTGLGIAKEDQAKVLEPFQQSESGLFKGGTGLGLSLSKELVHLMGGELSLESQVGKGSCFFFTMELPPAKAPVPKRSERSNEKDWCLLKTNSIKALVVDDIEVNRRLLSDILKSAGIEIEEAENGREAVDQTEKFKPDIIFMDIRMPVMDGKEAAIEINKQHSSNPLKIVAITASVFDHERDEGFAEIFVDYIIKPFRIERIYECIQSLLDVEFDRKEIRRENSKQDLNETIPPPQDIDFSQITIPVQLFFKFKDIIEEGDVTRFEKELVNLNLLGEDGKLLNQSLTPLAEKYEWEKILTILEQVKIMGKGHD